MTKDEARAAFVDALAAYWAHGSTGEPTMALRAQDLLDVLSSERTSSGADVGDILAAIHGSAPPKRGKPSSGEAPPRCSGANTSAAECPLHGPQVYPELYPVRPTTREAVEDAIDRSKDPNAKWGVPPTEATAPRITPEGSREVPPHMTGEMVRNRPAPSFNEAVVNVVWPGRGPIKMEAAGATAPTEETRDAVEMLSELLLMWGDKPRTAATLRNAIASIRAERSEGAAKLADAMRGAPWKASYMDEKRRLRAAQGKIEKALAFVTHRTFGYQCTDDKCKDWSCGIRRILRGDEARRGEEGRK